MIRRLSLRTRVAVAIAATTVIAVLIAAATVEVLFRRSLRGRTRAELATALAVMDREWRDEIDEMGDLERAAAEACKEITFPDQVVSLLAPDGRLLGGAPIDPPLASSVRRRPRMLTEVDHDLLVAPFSRAEGGSAVDGFVAVAQSRDPELAMLAELHRAQIAALLLSLMVGPAIGTLVVVRGFAPIAAMASAARAIGPADGAARVPGDDLPGEAGELARSFNDLLRRLGDVLGRQRRFIADASHELRTPLAAMRTEVDVTLLGAGTRSTDEVVRSLRFVGESLERIERIVEDLFLLARSDEGSLLGEPVPCYLADAARASAALLEPLASARAIELRVEAGAEGQVAGDERLLERMATNLAHNALRFATARVELRVDEYDGMAALSVRDDGPGIPVEDRDAVFDRFVRLDPARSAGSRAVHGGAGLGLAIAREIARAHGGSVELDADVTRGCQVIARIPLLAPEPSAAGA